MKNKSVYIYCFFCFAALLVSCSETYTPKPYGYVRIDVPDTVYSIFHPNKYPYSFNLSDNARISERKDADELYWIDIEYPRYSAVIHCSYKPINNNLSILSEESEKFVYKHAQMATSIPEQGYEDPERKVFGVLFEIQGNTASPYQFILTDSTRHFFRGAAYFNCTPNQDSLSPITQYIRTDIIELIESFEWK